MPALERRLTLLLTLALALRSADVPVDTRTALHRRALRAGTLDAELAAQLWLLVEARVPIVVAALAQGVGKSTLLHALLDFLPPDVRVVELAGETETFAWLPQATELGWPGVARPTPGTDPVRAETTVLLAAELSDHLPAYTWGAAARVAVRATVHRLRAGGHHPRGLAR